MRPGKSALYVKPYKIQNEYICWSCRVAGVTDLCDFPSKAKSLPKVSRSLIDTSKMSMEEVEEHMQDFKARGRPPFQIDANFLAQQQPGIVLTQNVCQTCDPTTQTVTQVSILAKAHSSMRSADR